MGAVVEAKNRPAGQYKRSAVAVTGPSDGYDSRRWVALPVLLSATFMSLFDIFVVNVAAPSIQHDLRATSATLQLLVAGYSFSYAAGLVTGARLGDFYGRRRLFIFGLLLFAGASLLCGMAPTAGLLLAGRLAQGLGAAAMVPQVLALATVNFPPEERPRVFSLFGATVGMGTVAGQVLGGVFLKLNILGLGWRPIFLVNVPIGITAAVLARRLLPESRPPLADRLDLLGVALLSTGLGAVIVPLVLGREVHWAAWTFASLTAGGLLLAAFLAWERSLGQRGGHPLLPLDLFEHRAFSVGLLVNLGFFAFFGSLLLTLTVFLQEGLHDSPLRAGLTFGPLGIAFALSSLAGRPLQQKFGTATIICRDRDLAGRSRRAHPASQLGRPVSDLARPGAGPCAYGYRQRSCHTVDRVRGTPERPGCIRRGRLGCARHHPAVLDGARHRRSGHAVFRPYS